MCVYMHGYARWPGLFVESGAIGPGLIWIITFALLMKEVAVSFFSPWRVAVEFSLSIYRMKCVFGGGAADEEITFLELSIGGRGY